MSGIDSSSGKYQTNINKGNISDTILDKPPPGAEARAAAKERYERP